LEKLTKSSVLQVMGVILLAGSGCDHLSLLKLMQIYWIR